MDCDKDCLLAVVRQIGPACHTNRRSCFYTSISGDEPVELMKPMI
jgi:phosphoribosyl-AMP cyclohydrolase